MDTLIIILAILAGSIGVIGSVLPALPGPPLSWVGLLILYFWGNGTNGDGESLTLTVLIVWLLITIAISVIDYIIPMYFTKITGGSKYAGRGALIGMIVGIFLTPIGMVLGSFLGAFLAEVYYAKKDPDSSFKSALGSFAGFILGTGLKIITSGAMLWCIISYCW